MLLLTLRRERHDRCGALRHHRKKATQYTAYTNLGHIRSATSENRRAIFGVTSRETHERPTHKHAAGSVVKKEKERPSMSKGMQVRESQRLRNPNMRP